MEVIGDMLGVLSNWMRHHLMSISMAIVATFLAVFGTDINRVIRKSIKSYNFFVRSFIFIAVCAFGYGLLTVLIAKVLVEVLTSFSSVLLAPAVITIFVLIGIVAEEKKQI